MQGGQTVDYVGAVRVFGIADKLIFEQLTCLDHKKMVMCVACPHSLMQQAMSTIKLKHWAVMRPGHEPFRTHMTTPCFYVRMPCHKAAREPAWS